MNTKTNPDLMEKRKRLIDHIVSLPYGSDISHIEISHIIGEPYGSNLYRYIVAAAKKDLLDMGKMVRCISRVGYHVVSPDDYPDAAVKKIVDGGRKISQGEKILSVANTDGMSESGKTRYRFVMDRTFRLNAAVRGMIVEVKRLNKHDNPLLPENIQK